ncbi:MAG: sporulation transcriptional regulator SpoIIID [Oscillospiraceae bacterium]|nr:sporulation transcriptional regulator SpoIIID [Oscillospiraceae bacterium]
MRNQIEDRARELGNYMIENNATVRSAAGHFQISKSTVHKDLTERLSRIDPILFEKVRIVLEQNKAERHIRGGMATRKKYQALSDHT